MDERQARDATLLEAFETAQPPHPAWSDADRAWADRVAREASPADASVERFVAERAAHALHRLREREPALVRALSKPAWRSGALAVTVAVAFAIGVALDAVGSGRHVNLLAPPLWATVAWNLVVYVLLAGFLLRDVARRGETPPEGWLARAARALAERAPTASRWTAAGRSDPAQRFAALWAARRLPLGTARARMLLHAGAAALALGLVAGLYARGLVLDYRAVWQSTLLDAPAAHAVVARAFTPASRLSGIALPDRAAFDAMRVTADGAAVVPGPTAPDASATPTQPSTGLPVPGLSTPTTTPTPTPAPLAPGSAAASNAPITTGAPPAPIPPTAPPTTAAPAAPTPATSPTPTAAPTPSTATPAPIAPSPAAAPAARPGPISATPGAPAAPWLHLIAITVVLFVVLPRLVLLLGAAGVAAWRRGHVGLPLDSAYHRRLATLRGSGGPVRIAVVPHGAAPSAQAVLAVRTLLADAFGPALDLRLLPPVPVGREDDPPAGVAGDTTHALVLVDLAATPEPESHGRLLASVARALPSGTPMALVLDASAFARRFAGLDDRLAQRRAAWLRFGDALGLAPLVVELESGPSTLAPPDIETVQAAFGHPDPVALRALATAAP